MMLRLLFLIYLLAAISCNPPDPRSNEESSVDDPLPIQPSTPEKLIDDIFYIEENLPSGDVSYSSAIGASSVYFFAGLMNLVPQSDVVIFNSEKASFERKVTGLSPRFLAAGSTLTFQKVEYSLFFGGAEFVQVTKSRGQRLSDGVLIEHSGSDYSIKQLPVNLRPAARDGHCVTQAGKGLFAIIGGDNSGIYIPTINFYDVLENRFIEGRSVFSNQTGADSPVVRRDFFCEYDVKTEEIVIFGGFNEKYGQLFDLWRYNAGSDSWTEIPVLAELSNSSSHKKVNPVYASITNKSNDLSTLEDMKIRLIFGTRKNSLDPLIVSIQSLTGVVQSKDLGFDSATSTREVIDTSRESLTAYSDLVEKFKLPPEPLVHDNRFYSNFNSWAIKSLDVNSENNQSLYWLDISSSDDLTIRLFAVTSIPELSSGGDHAYPVGPNGLLFWGKSQQSRDSSSQSKAIYLKLKDKP